MMRSRIHIRRSDSGFDLRSYLDRQRQKINRALTEILETMPQDRKIVSAMTYSLMAGGKRIRPVICLAAADAVGQPGPGLMKAACAIEMIHTYSLIHDDLPAMDNDALRRGKPTCHVAFNEPTAILAGDSLLTFAYEVLSKAGIDEAAHADRWFRVLHTISKAAGYRGMIEGQMRDIASEGSQLSLEDLESMHNLKTGALIEASIHTGAILGGGNPDKVGMLCQYAWNTGLAFQVADDILNVEGDPTLLGKAVGTDAALKKNTYPSLMGLEKSKIFAKKLVDNALQALDNFDNSADPLRAIAVYIINRKR